MIKVVECTMGHVGMMSRLMRDEDRREIVALYGNDVRKAIRNCYFMSSVRRAAFIDAELAAIWGLTGTLLSDESLGWLLTTPQIERLPIAFFKETKRQLAEFMETRSTIRGSVAADYEKAVDFLAMVGFSLSAPRPLGQDGTLYREAVMRKEWN